MAQKTESLPVPTWRKKPECVGTKNATVALETAAGTFMAILAPDWNR